MQKQTPMKTVEEQVRRVLVKVYAHGYEDCRQGLRIEQIDESHRSEADKYVDEILHSLAEQVMAAVPKKLPRMSIEREWEDYMDGWNTCRQNTLTKLTAIFGKSQNK